MKKLTAKQELLSQLIPGEEVDAVRESWDTIVKKWSNVAPAPEDIDVLNPPKVNLLDAYIHEQLIRLTKRGVRSSLKKLAWAAYCLFDPEYEKDWKSPENKLVATVSHRLGESDVLLTEYRDLRAHKDEETWTIQFQHDDGELVQRDRVFPFWGRELKHGLDSKEKATTFYRDQLKERGIL